MRLDEAIEILRRTYAPSNDPALKDFNDAIKLGIEALKRELEYRESMPPKKGELLPGETEE